MSLDDVSDEDGHNDAGERRELHDARDHRVQVGREVQHVRVKACTQSQSFESRAPTNARW